MKKMIRLVKGVLSGLLICACVSACSDDTVDNLSDENVKVENTSPAYLTISFKTNASTDSRVASRTDTEANDGDGHGTAEDSGHKDAGTDAESKVNKVLVIAHPTNTNVGFAKVYANAVTPETSTDTDDATDTKHFFVYKDEVTNTASKTAAPIELAIGAYKLLVVVNPPLDLYQSILGEANAYTTELAKVKQLYEKALDEAYTPTAEIYQGYLNGEGRTDGFMMSNVYETANEDGTGSIVLTADHTPDSPYKAQINVERAISKIAYRQINTNNEYKVTIETELAVDQETGAVQKADANEYEQVELYRAEDVNGKTVWVINRGGTFEVYESTDTQVTVGTESLNIFVLLTATTVQSDNDGKPGYYTVRDLSNVNASLSYAYDETAGGKRAEYTVKLLGYSLVNLSKSVNYVRHTVDYSALDGKPFGTVENKYLWTPDWSAKNAVTDYIKGFTTKADEWYYNPLHKVAEESNKLVLSEDGETFTNGTYYKPLSVVAGNEKLHSDAVTPEVGQALGYCLENSTDRDHQVHGLSTGISFVAKITGPDNAPVKLYRYNGYVYTSLQDIQNAWGAEHFLLEGETIADLVSPEFQLLVNKDVNKEELTQQELAKFNIVKYQDGICYYYTTEIKHFDNGDNSTMGYMEYAIMRNNIYSLAIKGIRFIGEPFLEPVPSTPNESGKAALELEVKIVPWTVRYNDIEF